MTDKYEGIVEIVKTNTYGANIALAAGYRLLEVVQEAEARVPKSPGRGSFWVEKWTAIVLGRPEGVASCGELPTVGRRPRVLQFDFDRADALAAAAETREGEAAS